MGYRHSKEIKALDKQLTVPGSFPFPANITDPSNYGSDKVDLGFNVKVCSMEKNCKHYLSLDMKKAVYQRLNGIQIKEQLTFGISTGINF